MEEYVLPDLFHIADDKEIELNFAKAELDCVKRSLVNLKLDHEKKLSSLINDLERIKEEKMDRVSTLRKEHIIELEKVKDFYMQQKSIDTQMRDILQREVSISESKIVQDEKLASKLQEDIKKKLDKLQEEKAEIEKKLQEQNKSLEIQKKIEDNKQVIKKIIGIKQSTSSERLSRGESSSGKIVKKTFLKRKES